MNFTEIHKLYGMLEASEIPSEFRNLYDGHQIYYPNSRDRICSVIQHGGSYGNRDNLLEIMGLLTEEESLSDDVVGYLSAKEVFERIRNHYNDNNNKEKTNG